MAFDIAKCMIRTPEQTREDIESVNRCLNPLSLVSTADLIAELERRWECITATKVYRDEEFNWSKWGNSKDGVWYQFDSGCVKGTDAYILVISGGE